MNPNVNNHRSTTCFQQTLPRLHMDHAAEGKMEIRICWYYCVENALNMPLERVSFEEAKRRANQRIAEWISETKAAGIVRLQDRYADVFKKIDWRDVQSQKQLVGKLKPIPGKYGIFCFLFRILWNNCDRLIIVSKFRVQVALLL